MFDYGLVIANRGRKLTRFSFQCIGLMTRVLHNMGISEIYFSNLQLFKSQFATFMA